LVSALRLMGIPTNNAYRAILYPAVSCFDSRWCVFRPHGGVRLIPEHKQINPTPDPLPGLVCYTRSMHSAPEPGALPDQSQIINNKHSQWAYVMRGIIFEGELHKGGIILLANLNQRCRCFNIVACTQQASEFLDLGFPWYNKRSL